MESGRHGEGHERGRDIFTVIHRDSQRGRARWEQAVNKTAETVGKSPTPSPRYNQTSILGLLANIVHIYYLSQNKVTIH